MKIRLNKVVIRPRLVLLNFIMVAVIAASCDGEKPSREQPPTIAHKTEPVARGPSAGIEPCGLLTPSEIEGVLGTSPGTPKREATPPSCIWPSADGANPQLVHLLVTSAVYQNYEDFVRDMQASGIEMQKVEGLGRFAVWTGLNLQVFTGRQMLQITVGGRGGSQARKAAQSLAENILARVK